MKKNLVALHFHKNFLPFLWFNPNLPESLNPREILA